MVKRNPALVRVATAANGDRIAFWYAGQSEVNFNVTAAEKKLSDLIAQNSAVMKSRSGQPMQAIRVELPLG